MGTVGLPGVSFGGVSRGDGWSAIGRSDYQMGVECHDGGVPAEKQRAGHLVEHVRHWLLLPDDVDPSIWTRAAVWKAAGEIETRRDAREGRFFDISWPRALRTDRIDGFIEDLYRTFVEMGLAVQIDWESSPASDEEPNNHIHGLISTRTLSNVGFAKNKCRSLDSWFRTGVRHRVADLLNAIAQDCDLDVRFDPAPNAAREDALPPEDRLPRRALRDRTAPGAEPRLSQRDRQRALRRQHEQVTAEIEALGRKACDLRAEIEAQFEEMSVLTPWQAGQEGVKPLPLEVTITALIGAGIVVDERIAVEGVGAAFVVGGTALIDAGDRILIEGRLQADAARAVHVLARRKGWRALSLTDSDGMPIPVPPEPVQVSLSLSRVVRERSRIELMGKGNLIRAAREIVQTIRAADSESRREMLAKVAIWGNRGLERLVAHLVGYTEEPEDLSVQVVLDMIDRAMGQDDDLWRRYVLEQDLDAMTVPGTPLSRPFRPHPQFYDLYLVPSGDSARHGHARAGGEVRQ